MNLILRKILIYLSVAAFLLTFFISLNAGASLNICFLRSSIALLSVGILGRFGIRGVFKDITRNLAEYEEQKKKEEEEEEKKKQEANEREHDARLEEDDNFDDEYGVSKESAESLQN